MYFIIRKFGYFRFSRMARINFSFLFSALSLFKDKAAQIAAGIQPIKVICKIRQRIPVRIFPRTMNDKNGNIIANNIVVSLMRLRIKIGFKSKRIFTEIFRDFQIFMIFFRMHSQINHYNSKVDVKIFILRA